MQLSESDTRKSFQGVCLLFQGVCCFPGFLPDFSIATLSVGDLSGERFVICQSSVYYCHVMFFLFACKTLRRRLGAFKQTPEGCNRKKNGKSNENRQKYHPMKSQKYIT